MARLVPIYRTDFTAWEQMRKAIYSSVDDKLNRQEMENIFDSDEWSCQFIEEESGQKIGLVEVSARNIVDGCLSSPVAYLEGLYLKPKYRNQGIGKQVVQMIMRWCSENGFTELATDTELRNEKAQHFYMSLGFKETDRVVEYKIDIK